MFFHCTGSGTIQRNLLRCWFLQSTSSCQLRPEGLDWGSATEAKHWGSCLCVWSKQGLGMRGHLALSPRSWQIRTSSTSLCLTAWASNWIWQQRQLPVLDVELAINPASSLAHKVSWAQWFPFICPEPPAGRPKITILVFPCLLYRDATVYMQQYCCIIMFENTWLVGDCRCKALHNNSRLIHFYRQRGRFRQEFVLGRKYTSTFLPTFLFPLLSIYIVQQVSIP